MATTMTPSVNSPMHSIDMARAQAFMERVIQDLSGAVVSTMCTLGDRLGLFAALAQAGASTSVELAAAAGLNERYVREWLNALTCAGYVDYDPETGRFSLPPEHAMALAFPASPAFMGGVYQHLPGLFRPLDQIAGVFQHGGGVAQDVYGEDFRAGMERISAGWFDHLLVQDWIARLPKIQAELERGARVADIGCGSGRALIKLAEAFPNSRFVGYDLFSPAIARAQDNARQAGVADRVRFEQRNVVEGLPESFDLITSFDVLHDIARPVDVLRGIRRALTPKGTYLLLEIACSDKLEQNRGPIGAILYGTSVMYCTPTSIANGGEGLGTMGLPAVKIEELCAQAGFAGVRQLPLQNPFNILYEIKP